jgi:hypothetical protein
VGGWRKREERKVKSSGRQVREQGAVESLIGVGGGVAQSSEGELVKSVTDWASASAMLILAVGSGQWAVGSGQWALGTGHWAEWAGQGRPVRSSKCSVQAVQPLQRRV